MSNCLVFLEVMIFHEAVLLNHSHVRVDKIKRSTNNSSTNNFVSRSVLKAGTLGIYQVARDE